MVSTLPSSRRGPPAIGRIGHGLSGAAGLALIVVALTNATAAVSTLIWEAAALVIFALSLGLLIWRVSLGASRGMLIAVHAPVGATGRVILAGWALG